MTTTEASNLNNSDPEQAPPPLNELYVIPSPDIFSFMYLNDLYQQLIDSTTTSLRTENPLEPRDGVISREEFVQHYGDNYKFNNRDIFRVTNIGGIIYYANVRSLTNPCFVDTGLLLFHEIKLGITPASIISLFKISILKVGIANCHL